MSRIPTIVLVSFYLITSELLSAFPTLDFVPYETEIGTGVIQAICRDHEGYLWVGSIESMGLLRLDGTEEAEYNYIPENDRSLSDDAVLWIFEDSRQRLWVGTRDGLNLYDRNRNDFRRFYGSHKVSNTLLDSRIQQISEDRFGNVWILTTKGLNLLNETDLTFQRFEIPSQLFSGDRITGMCIDGDKRILLVGNGPELVFFDIEAMSFSSVSGMDVDSNLLSEKRILIDSGGKIWCTCTINGLYRYDDETGQFVHYPSDGRGTGTSSPVVWDILEFPKGQLLLAVNLGGLNRLDINEDRFDYQTAEDVGKGRLSGNGATTLYLDSESVLWLGTSRDGLNYCHPNKSVFSTYSRNKVGEKLPNDVISCFYEDQDEILWVGTDYGGISLLDRNHHELSVIGAEDTGGLLRSPSVKSICADSRGTIYVFAWSGGVTVLHKRQKNWERNTAIETALNPILPAFIWQCVFDASDRLWVNTPDGKVYLYENDLTKVSTYELSIGDPYLSLAYIRERHDGKICLMNRTGFFEFSEQERQFYKVLDLPYANAFTWDSDGNLYVGTSSKGVMTFDRNYRFLESLERDRDLSSSYISSLEISGNSLWVATKGNLEWHDLSRKRNRLFDRKDGVQNGQFFLQSSILLKSGEFCFGGNKGFTLFDEADIHVNSLPPSIHFSKISVGNQAVDFNLQSAPFHVHPQVLKVLQLDWDENFLDIEFSAVNFVCSHRNQYAYRLQGVDQNWVFSDSRKRTASYKNLRPGNYHFEVKAANNDGVWSEIPLTLDISVIPPFWKTGWFQGLLFVFGILFLFAVVRLRVIHLKRQNALLEERIRERTALIEAQKEELEAQSEELINHKEGLERLVIARTCELEDAKNRAEYSDLLKTRFISNISHEIRTPLNAIIGLSEFLHEPQLSSVERDEFMREIRSSSDRLVGTIQDLLDFSALQSGQLVLSKVYLSVNEILHQTRCCCTKRYNEERYQRIVVELVPECDDEVISTDPERVSGLLVKLIDNALKYAEKSDVWIGAARSDERLEFYVSDNGPGIPLEQLEKIFESFYRLDRDEKLANGGVGLGLSLSRKLATVLGGTLECHSEVGKGTVFTLSLPFGNGVTLD